jgi:hypothetical protein
MLDELYCKCLILSSQKYLNMNSIFTLEDYIIYHLNNTSNFISDQNHFLSFLKEPYINYSNIKKNNYSLIQFIAHPSFPFTINKLDKLQENKIILKEGKGNLKGNKENLKGTNGNLREK